MDYVCDVVNIANEVEGIPDWTWVEIGTRTFTLIVNDWYASHKEKFLKHTEGRRKVCVQAGGCMGLYPRLLSDHFERVYTFEPDPLNFFCLTLNCQKNNIIKMQAALGDEHKLVTVQRSILNNPGMNTINDEHQIIPMVTIDSFNLDSCDYIQLDVELCELNVLRGALKTIEKYKPVISCELGDLSMYDLQRTPGLHHNGSILEGNTLEADILELLAPFGYQRVDMSLEDAIFKVV